jgi:hypothetical protein
MRLGRRPRRSLGEDPAAYFTRKLQEFKAGIVGPSPGAPAPDSTINWWCWESPGFKQCHALAFEAAQRQCESAGRKDDKVCLVTTADELAKKGCACPAEPPPAEMSSTTKLVLVVLAIGGVLMLTRGKKGKAS